MLKDTLPQPSSSQFQKKINSFLKERERERENEIHRWEPYC